MSRPSPFKQYHFHAILIWWHCPFKSYANYVIIFLFIAARQLSNKYYTIYCILYLQYDLRLYIFTTNTIKKCIAEGIILIQSRVTLHVHHRTPVSRLLLISNCTKDVTEGAWPFRIQFQNSQAARAVSLKTFGNLQKYLRQDRPKKIKKP